MGNIGLDKTMNYSGLIATAMTLVLLVACNGTQTDVIRQAPTATITQNPATNATATLKIVVPARSASAGKRRPQYVSPGTESVSLTLLQGSTPVYTFDQDLSTSNGCVSGAGGVTCTISLLVASGSYTANILTYALPNEAGALLSAYYGYPMTFVPGSGNNFSVTLLGIATSFSITPPSDPHVIPSGNGFWILGNASYPYPVYTFTIYPLDATGNAIPGTNSGAPALTVTSANSNVISVAPVNSYPNEFAVQQLSSSGSAVNLNASAAAVSGSGVPAASTSAPLTNVQITPVTSGNMQGWAFYNDCGGSNAGTASLVDTPTLLGTGSLQLSLDPNASTECITMATGAYDGTLLSNITTLQYSSYQPAGSNAIFFTFDIDYGTGISGYQGRLAFEPAGGGSVGAGWQTWNTLAGGWWADDPPGSTYCALSSPCTWSQVLSYWPNASIRLGDAIYFKAGSDWSVPNGFTGNVDDFAIGVSGSNTAYAF